MNNQFISVWEKKVQSTGKLEVYRIIEKKFGYEEYLNNIHITAWRKELTRLRISAHNLPIERGRYQKLERNEHKCNSGEIGDEIHFLLQCKYYDNLRVETIQKHIDEAVLRCTNKGNRETFNFIMQKCKTVIPKI